MQQALDLAPTATMAEWGEMGFDRSKGSLNALNEVDPFEVRRGRLPSRIPHNTCTNQKFNP
jgi:hypothetical protein